MVELESASSRERASDPVTPTGRSGAPTLVALLLVLTGCAAEPEGVPVAQEPRHRLVSDREFAQVLDIRILGSDTTLFHTHADPIAYACISASEMSTQVSGGDWSPPGRTCREPGMTFSNPEYAERPLTHRVANSGQDMFHLIGVHNLRDRSTLSPLGPAGPGTTGVDNDWFRTTTIALGPGEVVPAHRHDVATLLVLAAGGAAGSAEDGGPTNLLVEPGAWLWFEPGTHAITTADGQALTLVEIEVR